MADTKTILSNARAAFASAIDWDRQNRVDSLSDYKMLSGDQWPEGEKEKREADGRPALTFDRLNGPVRQVTGDLRRLNPAIKVRPSDDEATKETAELYESIIRGIEFESEASSVYERSAEQAAQGGIGQFRIVAEYKDPLSFDQKILVKLIRNPFSVYWDAESRDPTRADANHCFITSQVKKEEFERLYPDSTPADSEHDAETDGMENWQENGMVVVAEYFWKEDEEITIGITNDGRVIENVTAAHSGIVKTRKTNITKVMWAKISGRDILEGPTEFPSSMIPVIAVTGEELPVGDKVVRSSVIRNAKDGQRAYNYERSSGIEVTALQPKSPYMVTAKQIEGYKSLWDQANTAVLPYMVYTPDPKAPGIPQRIMPPASASGHLQGSQIATHDIKAATGIFDAGLGSGGNETSGVAIRQRQMESDISTSIYSDNLKSSIALAGRIIVRMLPKIYDTTRKIMAISADDKQELLEVNGRALDENLNPVEVNNLSKGSYDVHTTVGPSYSTRRQETAESMLDFVRAFPPAATIAGDLIARSMDWPGADKIADRLETLLPPGTVQNEDMPPEQVEQMQMQQQMQQQMGMRDAEAEIALKEAKVAETQADALDAQADAQKTVVETEILQTDIEQLVEQLLMQKLQQMGLGPSNY